ncbi:hypothetical protein ACF1GW_36610 [Streptomyces achromogenes]|uniref:hypothetical protein n=1 Tax=Streptomyces achromogenes TaxID=67255 RepID=UPI0037022765
MNREGLPYEECWRRQDQGLVPRYREPLDPAYAIPPFHPGTRARQRRGRHRVDGARVSGALCLLCLATLVVSIVLATTLPA